MFSTEKPSSSRRKDKTPAERLTPLQEKELENAGLRRQVRDFQLDNDELRARKEDLEADQVAKNVVIERLSNDLSRWELDNAELQKRNYRLQALLHDLFEKRYQQLQADQDRYRAHNDEYKSDLADAKKVMDKQSGPVTLAASKKAETKERANPQLEQSGSNNHAEELDSQKDLEIADLQRHISNLRQENNELRSKSEHLEADKANSGTLREDLKAKDEELEAKHEIIKGLSNDLAKRDLEIDSYKERIVQLRGFLEDLFGPIPLAASKKAETKEPAKPPQVEQSSSDTVAKRLISEMVLTTSIDATDNESDMVKIKDQVSHRTGSMKTFSGQPPINADCYQYLHTEDFENGGKRLKKAEVPETGSAGDRYAIPLSGMTDLYLPLPDLPLPHPPYPHLPYPHLPYPQRSLPSTASLSKEETTIVPRSSTPQAPTLPTNPQETQWSESVVSSANLQRIESVQTHAQVATIPPEQLISSADEEEEPKPEASVQTGCAAATSQTRGKYWPRGGL